MKVEKNTQREITPSHCRIWTEGKWREIEVGRGASAIKEKTNVGLILSDNFFFWNQLKQMLLSDLWKIGSHYPAIMWSARLLGEPGDWGLELSLSALQLGHLFQWGSEWMNGNSTAHNNIERFNNSTGLRYDIFRASVRDLRNETTLLGILVFLKNW